MTFEEYLKEHKGSVKSIIDSNLQPRGPKEYHDIIIDYPNRKSGYRRPILLTLWSQLYGGSLEDALLPAAAQQLSEDWILIHDDIMDNNDKRRGDETLHIKYNLALAINAGDSLHMVMWGMVYDAATKLNDKYKDGRGDRFFKKFSDMLITTGEGQFIDVTLTNRKDIADFTMEDYNASIHAKSGYYSVFGPMQLGMIIAGQPDEAIKKIEEYGSLIGKAFQIKDDILDCEAYFSEEAAASLKKKPGNDVWEGTKTAIVWHFYNESKAPADVKENVRQIYMKERPLAGKQYNANVQLKTEEDVAYVLQQFKDYGSIDYARNLGKELAQQALKIFDEHTKDTESPFKSIARDAINVLENRGK